ncbi:MAG: MlaC/ttg2D family ABC transporter substrate-binding protein [Rhodospirillales bacterium]
MMFRRTFLTKALFSLMVAIPLTGGAFLLEAAQPVHADTKGAEAFIATLAKEAVDSLTDKAIDRSTRIGNFRKLFNAHFAVENIGRWVLGKNWRSASEDEQTEYLKLFEDLMVVSYVDRFADYAEEELVVKGSQEQKNVIMVQSELNQPASNQAIRVDWRVGEKDGAYKILDVVVQGTSMSATLRSEFGSIIKQKDGSVAGLIEVLREKTAELNAS